MKKQLRLLMLMLLCAVSQATWAADVKKSISAADILTATATDPLTITTEKNGGSTAPTYNEKGSDYRIYAKGSITISAASVTIKNVVFNISTQGKKRLAPITADGGTVATQVSGDETVSWSGSTTSVTFTVGDNANYGSDGDSKAGQLCFTSVVVTYEEKGTVVTIPVPTFDPESGETVKVGDNITISTTATGDNAGIVYTTNGVSIDESTTDPQVVTGQTATITITEDMVSNGKVSIHAKSFVGSNYSDEEEAVYNVMETGVIFKESFSETDGTGGRDGQYSGTIATSIINADSEWDSFDKCNGAANCLKFGTSTANGTATTGEIALTGDATLTFSAAGWGSGTNKLTVSATGGTLKGDTQITLVDGAWNDYTVNITGATGALVLTFTGKRGFIDDIEITESAAADDVTVTIGQHGYATFSTDATALDLSQLPQGITAYVVTELTQDYATIEPITEPVPANTGLLFQGDAGDYQIPASTGETVAPASNILLATSAILPGSLVEGAPSVWALGVRPTDAKVGFMQVTQGTSISQGNKAYIIDESFTEYNEAAFAAFIFDDETPAETTQLRNVSVQVIDANAPMYNLAGQRVGKDYRGIVIQNGKKIIK